MYPRFELRRINGENASGHPGIVPVVQTSARIFRGRHTVNMASLRPDFARELALEIHNGDWLGYTLAGLTVVRSITWQEAFHQGRRRHEPRSSGFLLEVAPEMLAKLAKNHWLIYWIRLDVDRSTDKYEPESRITWSRRSDVFLLHAVPVRP